MASFFTTWHTILPDYEAVCDSNIVNSEREKPREDWENLYEGDIDNDDYESLTEKSSKHSSAVYGLNVMPIQHCEKYALGYLDTYLARLSSRMANGKKETVRFKDHVRTTINGGGSFQYSLLRTQEENFYMVLGEQMTEEGMTESRYITFLKGAVTENPPSAEAGTSHANLAIYARGKFQKSLKDHIISIQGHLLPCLRALANGQQSYSVNGQSFELHKGEVKQAEKKFSYTRDFKWTIDGKQVEQESNNLYKVHLGGHSSDHLLLFREQKYSGIPKVYVLIGVYGHSDIGTRDGHSKQSKTPVNTTGKAPKKLAEEEMRAIMSTFNIDENTGQMKS